MTNGLSAEQAALNIRSLLEITNLSATKPEGINFFEVGYGSVLLNNSLVLDAAAYVNVYADFLGQVEVLVPASGEVGTDASVLNMIAANRAR